MRSIFWTTVITINTLACLAILLILSSIQINQEAVRAAYQIIQPFVPSETQKVKIDTAANRWVITDGDITTGRYGVYAGKGIGWIPMDDETCRALDKRRSA